MTFVRYMQQLWMGVLPGQLARAILVALVFEFLIWLVNRLIETRMKPILLRDAGDPPAVRVHRRRLLLRAPMLLNRAVLSVIAVLMILRIFRLPTGAELLPIGLALVVVALVACWRPLRDAAQGYILLYDHAYTRGERVTLGRYTGKVVDIHLRTTQLVTDEGQEVLVPHSQVGEVVNHTRGEKLARPPASSQPRE